MSGIRPVTRPLITGFFKMRDDADLHVLTLVAAEQGMLDDRLASTVANVLGETMEPDWLAPGLACDVRFLCPDFETRRQELEAKIQSKVPEHRIDFALQADDGRRKSLLIADMDATIVVGETLDELADETGLKDQIAAITARAMGGELDFAEALRERVAMLAGLSEGALERTYSRIVPMPGADTLVATMKAHGAFTALVSGGFDYFTSRVRGRLGFDIDSANVLEIEGGALTGQVVEPIRGRDAKREMLLSLCQRLAIAPDAAAAIGDGANDLAMIAEAGMGVAYHAKPALRDAARFKIDHGDLRTLLYFQGYRFEDIQAE
ncbi:MAG: phosphoserine phosphatase SerB [Pseudomonadota bacterium]